MDSFFKFFLIFIVISIVTLLVYFIIQQAKNTRTFKKYNKIKGYQRKILLELVDDRIANIERHKKAVDEDELSILKKVESKLDTINHWDEFDKAVNDSRVYSFLNVAIMDYLYVADILKDDKNRIVNVLLLLDCLNGGVQFDNKKLLCFPENIDIQKTILLIINNQEELSENAVNILSSPIATAWKQASPDTYENYKNSLIKTSFSDLISKDAITKTQKELINKKYLKDLSNPAKYVIYKIVIEVLSDIIYKCDNYKKLSENSKIYLRILTIVISNMNYDDLYFNFVK